jgi:DtxR family transcriptional regulator, Mn-dependent transcriptional regulator
MADQPPRLSRSVEDYLKAIYALCEGGEPAATRDIADRLDVQPASVSGMVKRLAESGLLEHVPYRGVRLTGQGSRAALRILRRHRILETYLHDRLGFSWDDLHEEAERLEHAVSDRLIDRMAAALDDPSHDPHGAPIPDASGEINAARYPTLDDPGLPPRLVIQAVQDEDPERLRYLEARGLLPGVSLHLETGKPRGDSVTVRVGGEEGPAWTLGLELASRIHVAPGEGVE